MSRSSRFSQLAVAAIFLAGAVAVPSAQLQVPAVPVGPLTLEQVLELAESRSETIAFAEAGVRRAEGERTRARSGLYPQLSASASYDRSLASEFEGVFDNQTIPGADEPDGEGSGFEDLPFGRANTWRVSLAFTQNLYTGGRQRAQEAIAAVGQEAAGLGVTTARAQLLFDVTQAYYDAALSDRLVAIAEASRDQSSDTLKQTQAGFDAGTQPEFEVLRARVTRDNQTPLVIRQRVNREVALLRLKEMLDLPADYDLRLADALDDERLAPAPAFAARVTAIEAGIGVTDPVSFSQTVQTTALPARTAVAEAAAGLRLSEASLALAEAQRRPGVSLNTTYSRIGYPSAFFPAFDRANWSVGATVNLPILTGGRQRGDEQVARADVDQARVQLRRVEELAALDSRSAWAELLAARAAWEATAGTVQQAARAYEIADVRFIAGVSTQLELSDSRLQLRQAEANRALAARDLQVARARVALLPDLPLGGSTVPAPPLPQPLPPQQQPGISNAAAQGALSQTGTR